ncbi:MAG TPA: SDR family NAD(P)-dependent oxidoreductase, partial [Flavobacteriales bacterium]|nr:SDR family NAD(P)-dependent oxidoreductase [Flavobacteriales bacterium]
MKSRVVVITGGTSGIGRALCDCFAKANYQIVLAARSVDKLKKVQKELSLTGTQILVVKTDVRLEEDCKNLAAETINCYGQIDVLINNAGITWYESDNDGINISKQRDLI